MAEVEKFRAELKQAIEAQGRLAQQPASSADISVKPIDDIGIPRDIMEALTDFRNRPFEIDEDWIEGWFPRDDDLIDPWCEAVPKEFKVQYERGRKLQFEAIDGLIWKDPLHGVSKLDRAAMVCLI
jgi:hypothetical protein